MYSTTKCREKTEGWVGRRRTYICRECHLKFQTDRLSYLPEKERVCHNCKDGFSFIFTDKLTGKDIVVKATDVELATLRAWKINPNVTFKVPQTQER